MALSDHHVDEQDFDKAIKLLQDHISNSRTDYMHNRLGEVHLMAGNAEQARIHFSQALRDNPHYQPALDGLADAVRELNGAAEGEEDEEEVREGGLGRLDSSYSCADTNQHADYALIDGQTGGILACTCSPAAPLSHRASWRMARANRRKRMTQTALGSGSLLLKTAHTRAGSFAKRQKKKNKANVHNVLWRLGRQ